MHLRPRSRALRRKADDRSDQEPGGHVPFLHGWSERIHSSTGPGRSPQRPGDAVQRLWPPEHEVGRGRQRRRVAPGLGLRSQHQRRQPDGGLYLDDTTTENGCMLMIPGRTRARHSTTMKAESRRRDRTGAVPTSPRRCRSRCAPVGSRSTVHSSCTAPPQPLDPTGRLVLYGYQSTDQWKLFDGMTDKDLPAEFERRQRQLVRGELTTTIQCDTRMMRMPFPKRAGQPVRHSALPERALLQVVGQWEHEPMIIDSHAHLHPSQADLEDWDFDGTELTRCVISSASSTPTAPRPSPRLVRR